MDQNEQIERVEAKLDGVDLERETDDAVDAIIDWCASGQGIHSGPSYFSTEIKEIVDELRPIIKNDVWQALFDTIADGEGWTIDDIEVLAKIFGKKGKVVFQEDKEDGPQN
jgi:hypothetical protein